MRVLYVEDDVFLREIIEQFFELGSSEAEGFEYSLDLAEDGEKGLALYKENDYDVVFSDINMPNMDGIEMLKQFSKVKDSHPPIYVVTGYSENEMHLRIGKDEMPDLADIIFKPVLPNVIVDLAKKHKK